MVGVLLSIACGDRSPITDETAQAVAPAGSDAIFVSHTIPSSMLAGQTVVGVTVTVQNTGAASPANDWNSQYSLRRTAANVFGFSNVQVTGVVVTGNSHTFTFNLTAPATTGTRNLTMRMRSNVPSQRGFFGQTLSVPITVATAAFDAAVETQSIPSPVAAGTNVNFSITMRNTGSTAWTGSNFRLTSVNTPANLWGVTEGGSLGAAETVAPGATRTFDFVVTAPTTLGTYDSRWQMTQVGGVGNFGTIAVRTGIVVSAAVTYGASVVSQIVPPHILSSGNAQFTITMRNTGTATWNSAYHLRTVNAQNNLWNIQNIFIPVGVTVAPNQTHTFTFTVTAPNSVALYDSRWQMRRTNNNNTLFGEEAVTVGIVVDNVAENDALVVNQVIPGTINPGATASFSITMRNWGSIAWPVTGTTFRLSSVNTPANLWTVTTGGNVGATVLPGATQTFTFNATAPLVPGFYDSEWQMEQVGAGGAGAGLFGDVATRTGIEVPLVHDAAVVDQTIPAVIEPGATANFSITMQNTGSVAWTGSNFRLASANTPVGLWGTTFTALGAAESVPVNGTRVFNFSVTAPATPGTYDSEWGMEQLGGAGTFGEIALTTGIIVTFCGNGVINAGEQCDDTNLANGDGCSSTCQVEAVVDDFLAGSNRTFIGSSASGQASLVALGDANGDGITDLLIGEVATVLTRRRAGRVVGFGGAGLLNGSSSVLPTGASFEILGAEADDLMGAGGASGLFVADVTGDGVGDVIVSATNADGVGNTKESAGETYVIAGGPGLNGVVDLGAAPADARLIATIIGRDAQELSRVIAVGDLDDDGIADLVIGAPNSSLAGLDSGAVFVVRGGPTLVGSIDLATGPANLIATIGGAGAGDHVGYTAAVADAGGSAARDLLLGAQTHAEGGRTNTGAAWLLFGPLAGNLNLTVNFDVRWFGATSSDRWGTSVAIGNVVGTAAADVVIGGMQHRNAATQQVGAIDVWAGPLVGGTTFDLSSGALPTARIQGAAQYDDAGSSLSLADYNRDGYLDIPVASSQADGPADGRDRAGEVAIVLGGTTLPALFDLAITSPARMMYGADSLGRLGRRENNMAFGTIQGTTVLCVGAYLGGGAGAPGRVDCVDSPY